MHHPLQTLRRVLEHELAVYGPYVPLGDPAPAVAEAADAGAEPAPPAAKAVVVAADDGQAEDVDQTPPAQDIPARRRFRAVSEERSLLKERGPAEPPTEQPVEAKPAAPAAPKPPPFNVQWTPPVAGRSAPAASPASASVDTMANLDLFGKEVDPSKDPSRPFWERVHALVPKDSPLFSMQSLEEIKAYVDNTVLVPIDEARQHAVLGVGDPDANLVIIGEAPGADEDRTGEPFTGRAGQLLNKILAAINFAREDVYITNILKSRPPNNRDPVPAEVEAHIPILYKQLSLIKPRLILCVGKTAGNSLLGRRSSLGALRDKFHDYYGIPLMVTYHPAALLRNPQWKRPTWEDMKLLRTRYDQLVNT